jgi:hypothetical protein
MYNFSDKKSLLGQLSRYGLELDQKLHRALEVSASKPDLRPEDTGFPDSYLTLALYRLNSVLTDILTLDDSRLNLFHEYKLAQACLPSEVRPGQRLCRVLSKAAELAAPGKTIGSGHFLKAVVSLTLDEPPEPAWGFEGQVIHNTFSIETLLWGMGHTAWTPVEKAPELQELLRALDGRNPVDDFQYLMTLENKKFVFRPVSILGSYRMIQRAGSKNDPQLAVLTHFKDRFAGVTPDELLELEDLINAKSTREAELQRFFEAHPQFLRIWDCREIFPHVYLTREDEGPLIPDFLLLDRDLQRATIVDLKLPRARTVASKKNRERFSSLVEEARSQMLEYRDWFENRANRRKLQERFGMEIYRPRLGIIIGSSTDLSCAYERQKLQSRYSDVDIVTYDDIVAHARRRLSLIRSAER